MNEDREQAFDDFLETRVWDAAQQALFDALRAAFLAGWAAAPCARQSGRGTGAGGSSFLCPRPSSCLPLTREVANPKDLTEGEIWRA